MLVTQVQNLSQLAALQAEQQSSEVRLAELRRQHDMLQADLQSQVSCRPRASSRDTDAMLLMHSCGANFTSLLCVCVGFGVHHGKSSQHGRFAYSCKLSNLLAVYAFHSVSMCLHLSVCMAHNIKSHHITSRHVTPHHNTPHHTTPHHTTSTTSCCIVLH